LRKVEFVVWADVLDDDEHPVREVQVAGGTLFEGQLDGLGDFVRDAWPRVLETHDPPAGDAG
jgi:hypothetical protein